jgi:hypothetical protein
MLFKTGFVKRLVTCCYKAHNNVVKPLLVLALLAIGCKTHDEPPPPTTDLILVAPGLPPLKPLRYAAVKGTKTTLELAIESRLEAGEIKSASPGLVFTLEVAIDDVTADGSMKTTTTIQDLTTRATRDQPGGGHVLDEAETIKGLAITATLSPDGRLTDVKPNLADKKLSEAAAAQITQLAVALPQLAMPLPTAPVGIGAKWRSSRALAPASTLALTAVTTIDITAITGPVVTFVMTSTVHGADQTVTQDSVSVDVKAITGTASGTGTIDLSKLALAGKLGAELHMTMTAGGETSPMMMGLELTTSTR